ncbi:MAG TPA: RNA-binding protein [Acidiferrobacteraceae bacterium]|nr:RNA-binding protein [Acidiferrobacteraceae bacterium]
MKILVRNLSRETTQAEVLALFKAYGGVRYCNLVMDKATGESKGFGFVDMPRADEAKEAIQALNAQDVGGSKIRVKKAKEAMMGATARSPWKQPR